MLGTETSLVPTMDSLVATLVATLAEAEEVVAAEEAVVAEAEVVGEPTSVEAEAMVVVMVAVVVEEATMYLTPTILSGIMKVMNGHSSLQSKGQLLELEETERIKVVETTVESMPLKWPTKLLPAYSKANANHNKLLACNWNCHP